jgi:hypothetical protein
MKLTYSIVFLGAITAQLTIQAIRFPCPYEAQARAAEIAKKPEFKNFLPAIFPMFSLGNRMMPKGRFAALERYIYQKNENSSASILVPTVRYGITDKLTIRWHLPIFIDRTVGKKSSDGTSNLVGVIEYSLFKHRVKETNREYQFNLIAGMDFKTETHDAKPSVGYGGTSFLVGTTGSSLSKKWYTFYSLAGAFSTTHNKQHPGSQFFYEIGAGYTIKHSILHNLCVLLEMDGILSDKDKLAQTANPNSGGNIIYLGPSIEYRYWTFLGAVGIQFPIVQHLNGNQDKRDFRFSCLGLFVF